MIVPPNVSADFPDPKIEVITDPRQLSSPDEADHRSQGATTDVI
jgi:hypothetical protein